MRLGEFFEAMDAFRRESEAGRIHAGNLIRGLAVRVVNLFVAKKDKIKDERKYWPMPWDEPDEDPDRVARSLAKMTDEQRQAKVNEFLSRLNHGS
jgi:hypothetical protein